MTVVEQSRSDFAAHNHIARHAADELGHVPLSSKDAQRSVKNIALWNTYLPTACVRAMVRLGWDYTT